MTSTVALPVGLGISVPTLSVHTGSRGYLSGIRKAAAMAPVPGVADVQQKRTPPPPPPAAGGVTPARQQQTPANRPSGVVTTPKPLNFFNSLGDMWSFLLARIRMWWYQNRIKSGKLTADQWKTVHKDAQTLSTNRFGRAVGGWLNPGKYNDDYYAGLPRFFKGVEKLHSWNNGNFGKDDKAFKQDQRLVQDTYSYGVRHGFFDDDFQKKHEKNISIMTDPALGLRSLSAARWMSNAADKAATTVKTGYGWIKNWGKNE